MRYPSLVDTQWLKILNSSKSAFCYFLLKFVTLHNYHIMFSRYQITKEHISDAINAFHNGDYTNPTVVAHAFWVNTKIVH